MKTDISFLKKGDKIALVSPAKAIAPSLVMEAKTFWENQGYEVKIGTHALGQFNYFSGTVFDRLNDFQEALDDENTKAIICNRGGYGCIQLMDYINWTAFLKKPKWIIGFSDVTVFHQFTNRFTYPSIHASMPLNYATNTENSLSSLVNLLKGNLPNYILKSSKQNKIGSAKGILLGGNLSILYSLVGTEFQSDYTNCILFVEDLAEQLYHIDRMFYSLAKASILRKIKGLIVGGMTELKDTETTFGATYQEIILKHFEFTNIPIVFDFPAGHIDDNRALLLGKEIHMEVTESQTKVYY